MACGYHQNERCLIRTYIVANTPHMCFLRIQSVLAYEGGTPDSNSGAKYVNIRSWQLHALKTLSAQIVLILMENFHHKQGRK